VFAAGALLPMFDDVHYGEDCTANSRAVCQASHPFSNPVRGRPNAGFKYNIWSE
jgi:hypothetical protein